ncbi:MAG: acetate--CoA ligase family protein [Deltaproteobacteria bacterium]|nr:acetate--CoA ligase family protein [Deltaproteobacteria bacterium]
MGTRRTIGSARPGRATVIAADADTARHVTCALGPARKNVREVVGARGLESLAGEAEVAPGVLVVAPWLGSAAALIAAVDRAARSDVAVIVWAASSRLSGSDDDAWILDRLLEQRGAMATRSLVVAGEAARLVAAVGGGPLPAITVSASRSDLAARMARGLGRCHLVPKPASRRTAGLVVTAGRDGALRLTGGKGGPQPIADADAFCEALALVAAHEGGCAPDDETQGDRIPVSEVDAIVRPPARLLSETTSKRLLGCFGIGHGPEQLCRSANDAVRAAADMGGPVVVKLVRPALEGKAALGAVRLGAVGASAVRRAAHSLLNMAAYMGPPPALGVLVARQVDGGARAWLKLVDHPLFGRIVVAGPGDVPSERGTLALGLPLTEAQARAAVVGASLAGEGPAADTLAAAVAAFGRMAHSLGPRLTRAEIHPLAAFGDGAPALALDALVGVA